jgi:hypothetical protein
VAGRIRSIEKSSDLIEHGTRDLPACSIVPQRIMLGCSLDLSHISRCIYEEFH